MCVSFFFQAEDGIRDGHVTGVQTCALPISPWASEPRRRCSGIWASSGTWPPPARRSWPSCGSGSRCTRRAVSCCSPVKIGRASCREREENEEGEGWVKKKKEESREERNRE